MQYYLVGGAVRDWLLGTTPREFDMSFDGSVEAFVRANPHARKAGRANQVWILDGLEYSPLKGANLADDLLARDLTLNALAVDEHGRLHAHPQALDDLRTGVLRPCSSTSLRDDPGRVFRVARLACQLPSFTVLPETLEQMRETAPFLEALPAERVCRELLKALHTPQPGRWLAVLRDANCLLPWFAELAEADTVTAGPPPRHQGSVLKHLMDVMNHAAGDPLAVWMALCHDLGKITTNPSLLPHHYRHEERGVTLALELATRLGMPRRHRQAAELASRLHMKAGNYHALRMGTRRDLMLTVHKVGLDEPFWRMVEADSGLTLREEIRADLHTVHQVTLPAAWRDRGAESGRQLREMQCRALAESRRKP